MVHLRPNSLALMLALGVVAAAEAVSDRQFQTYLGKPKKRPQTRNEKKAAARRLKQMARKKGKKPAI